MTNVTISDTYKNLLTHLRINRSEQRSLTTTQQDTVIRQFIIWLLSDDVHGVRQHFKNREGDIAKRMPCLDKIIAFHQQELSGENVSHQEWEDCFFNNNSGPIGEYIVQTALYSMDNYNPDPDRRGYDVSENIAESSNWAAMAFGNVARSSLIAADFTTTAKNADEAYTSAKSEHCKAQVEKLISLIGAQ
jgi:hypothetical protein